MTVRNEGVLARFAVRNGQLTAVVVKPKLVEPNRRLELSVFRIGGLGYKEVQGLGINVVRRRPDAKRLYGWAEFDDVTVQSVSLTIHDDDNPPGHGNIIGWPADRAKRKLVQRQLADKATPVLVSPPVDVSGDVVA